MRIDRQLSLVRISLVSCFRNSALSIEHLTHLLVSIGIISASTRPWRVLQYSPIHGYQLSIRTLRILYNDPSCISLLSITSTYRAGLIRLISYRTRIRRQKSTHSVRCFCLPCTALHPAEFICGHFAPVTVVHCKNLCPYVYVIPRWSCQS